MNDKWETILCDDFHHLKELFYMKYWGNLWRVTTTYSIKTQRRWIDQVFYSFHIIKLKNSSFLPVMKNDLHPGFIIICTAGPTHIVTASITSFSGKYCLCRPQLIWVDAAFIWSTVFIFVYRPEYLRNLFRKRSALRRDSNLGETLLRCYMFFLLAPVRVNGQLRSE